MDKSNGGPSPTTNFLTISQYFAEDENKTSPISSPKNNIVAGFLFLY